MKKPFWSRLLLRISLLLVLLAYVFRVLVLIGVHLYWDKLNRDPVDPGHSNFNKWEQFDFLMLIREWRGMIGLQLAALALIIFIYATKRPWWRAFWRAYLLVTAAAILWIVVFAIRESMQPFQPGWHTTIYPFPF